MIVLGTKQLPSWDINPCYFVRDHLRCSLLPAIYKSASIAHNFVKVLLYIFQGRMGKGLHLCDYEENFILSGKIFSGVASLVRRLLLLKVTLHLSSIRKHNQPINSPEWTMADYALVCHWDHIKRGRHFVLGRNFSKIISQSYFYLLYNMKSWYLLKLFLLYSYSQGTLYAMVVYNDKKFLF